MNRVTEQNPAKVGDTVIVSHYRCCGKRATVIHANEKTFTMVCPCGSKLQVMQRDGYPRD